MNETPTPHSAPQGGSQQGGSQQGNPQQGGPQTPFGAGFFTWIRGLGISRGYDRWFAGVAGGIAQRANIDPIIVRGIFIVLAVLGGPGILLYLVGWVLLPDQGGKIHLEEVFRGRSGTAAVIATVAVAIFVVIPVFFGMLGLPFTTGWALWNSLGMPSWLSGMLSVLVWIAVIGGVIALVSRMVLRRGRSAREQRGTDQHGTDQYSAGQFGADQAAAPGAYHGPTAPPQAGAQDPHAAPTTQFDDWSARLNDGAEKLGERANAWGENIGRQADAWSVRYADEYDRKKLGAAHVVITLACALLAAGGIALWAFGMGLSSGHVLIASLLAATGVLALSLIVAGVRGRHSGWVGFLAACGVIALVFTALLPGGTRFHPFGKMSVGSDAPAAVLIAGKTDIDLESFAHGDNTDSFGADPFSTEHLEVWQGFGTATITLPETTPVILNIRLLAGTLTDEDSRVAGPFLSRTIDTRANHTIAAPTVTVTLVAGTVDVEGSTAPRARVASTTESERIEATDPAALADLRRELDALLEEQTTVTKELGDQRISDTRRARLEANLDEIRDEIADTRKELAQ